MLAAATEDIALRVMLKGAFEAAEEVCQDNGKARHHTPPPQKKTSKPKTNTLRS